MVSLYNERRRSATPHGQARRSLIHSRLLSHPYARVASPFSPCDNSIRTIPQIRTMLTRQPPIPITHNLNTPFNTLLINGIPYTHTTDTPKSLHQIAMQLGKDFKT